MDLELSLLVQRFPNHSVQDFGSLVKDFFCARSVSSGTYGGRLFVTRNALVFVSTYMNSESYDCCVPLQDITLATTFHKSIIPTLEIEWTKGKESFTNFYDLKAVEKTLKCTLPLESIRVKHGSLRGLNRMRSVPAKADSPLTPLQTQVVPKPEPCPFFSKCGFCPRRVVCKLDHTLQTLPQMKSSETGLCPRDSCPCATSPPGPSSGSYQRSLSKKRHMQEPHGGKRTNHASSKALTTPDTHQQVNSEFLRSVSSPAVQFGTKDGATENGMGFSDGVRSSTSPAGGSSNLPDETRTRFKCSPQEVELPKSFDFSSQLSSSSRNEEYHTPTGTINEEYYTPAGTINEEYDTPMGTRNEEYHTPAGTRNEEYDMPTGTRNEEYHTPAGTRNEEYDMPTGTRNEEYHTPVGTRNEEYHTPEGTPTGKDFLTDEFMTPEDSSTSLEPFIPITNSTAGNDLSTSVERNVFVFSASSPSLSPTKRRNAVVDSSSPLVDRGETSGTSGEGIAEGEGEGGNEETSREVALLTQQLELESDSDSLHGDLDVETQMRIMNSFSQDKVEIPEAPPPYSSLKPLVQDPRTSSESSSPELLSPNKDISQGDSHKRPPCLFFLAGYCRNGMECPNYHGMDPDLDIMEFDELSLIPIPPKIRVHSGLGIGRSDINSGDKIILSPHILVSCEQQELSYPIAFKMENIVSGRTVYGGVLQFTSPSPDSAYLPQWMMEHLQVQDGDEVFFQNVDLPKGKFVRLQPVSSSWLGIPYDKRMAMMEFQLRNFQTLTEGTKVTLTYELNKYTLKVLECKPAKGISIVDADLTTDIIEPADLNRFHSVEEGQAENIGLDEPMKCHLKADSYRHFVLLSLPGKPLPSKLRVEVESSKGDADLFLSQTFATPCQSRYTWYNQEVEKSVICLNSQDEKNYDINMPLYGGVMAVLEDAEFTITFHDDTSPQTSKACDVTASPPLPGKTLRGIASSKEQPSGATMPTSSDPLPPGHMRCSYCNSAMPSLRLLMHERHCAQSTFKCPLCQICLPKAAERKHSSVSHQLLMCECGEELTQLALHRHQETDCSKRMVTCPFKWCNLCFPMDQLASHENLCGRKKVECPVCKEDVSQLEMEMHLVAFHRVEIDKIDWEKPLTNQDLVFEHRELRFKCPCGMEFEFQDDMEVHQLTECPCAEDKVGLTPTASTEGEGLVSMDKTSVG